MKDILENAKNNDEMLSIYFDKENTETFAAGYVQQVSDEFVMLASVSPTGKYDGYEVRHLDDIWLIEEKNKYLVPTEQRKNNEKPYFF